jgi:hypothetical protein
MIPCALGCRETTEGPTLQRDALGSRFGPALYDLFSEQLASLFEVVQKTHERWFDKDETAEHERGRTLRRAREAERLAEIASQQAALMSVQAGRSESIATQDAGLDRMTSRKMLAERRTKRGRAWAGVVIGWVVGPDSR